MIFFIFSHFKFVRLLIERKAVRTMKFFCLMGTPDNIAVLENDFFIFLLVKKSTPEFFLIPRDNGDIMGHYN